MNNYCFILFVWLGVQVAYLLNQGITYYDSRGISAAIGSLLVALFSTWLWKKGKTWLTTNRKQHSRKIQQK